MADLAHYFDFRGRPKFQRATIFSNTRHPRCASARPHRGAMQRVVTVTNFADASLVKRHLSYLQREGKGLDGAKPELFSHTDDTEISKEPLPEEERFYRVILSPDNGNDLDMKAYTRAFFEITRRKEATAGSLGRPVSQDRGDDGEIDIIRQHKAGEGVQ